MGAVACWIACICAGAGCEPAARVTDLALSLRALPSCELTGAESLELQAFGDFPTRHESLDLRSRAAGSDEFPLGTRELGIEGVFAGLRASGRIDALAAVSGASTPLLMLPAQRSCPLGDPLAAASEGAAVSALPRGGFLIAGGTSPEGKALSSGLVLAPGRDLLEQIPDGMLLRRRYASASLAGSLVVVAGGAADRGDALETYEVYDSELGAFAGERGRRLASGPRMQHGAALLPDGRILLVGGRSEPDGPPLASVELVDLDSPGATDQEAPELHQARVAPSVLVLESGAIVIAAGLDAAGAVARSLERFEPDSERFVDLGIELPPLESAAASALPGDRIAWVGCDTRQGGSCRLALVLVRGDRAAQHEVPLDFASHAPLGLLDLRMISLDDGRLLITGRDPGASITRRAFVADVGAKSLVPVEASRTPSALLSLADGVIAELDAAGGSLRREGSLSVYESPSEELIRSTRYGVVLDAPEHWQRSSEGLTAQKADARVDVPHLRFDQLGVELISHGDVTVKWAAPDAPELSIRLASGEPAPGCKAAARSDDRTRIELRGGAIEILASARGEPACRIPWPGVTAARIAFEAQPGALLESIRLTRR